MAREPRAAERLPRALLVPIGATSAIATLSGAAVVIGATPAGTGFVLPWLLMGLVAGYALSGSA